VEVQYVAGHKAVLTIYKDGEEQEQITLSDYRSKGEMHALMVEKGFVTRSVGVVASDVAVVESKVAVVESQVGIEAIHAQVVIIVVVTIVAVLVMLSKQQGICRKHTEQGESQRRARDKLKEAQQERLVQHMETAQGRFEERGRAQHRRKVEQEL
jgi:hypothetical protein